MEARPTPDKWTTQLRKGVLELCILNVIAGSRRYGYEIAKTLSERHEPAVREGTVYPILSRLRREGLLSVSLEESPEGPPRKYYALTEEGRRQLEQMNLAWDQLQRSVASLRGRNES